MEVLSIITLVLDRECIMGIFDTMYRDKLEQKRNAKAATAMRNNLGFEGYGRTDTVPGDAMYPAAEPGVEGFVINSNDGRKYPIRRSPSPVYEGYGILADNTMNPKKMRLAADLMEAGSPVGNSLALSELGNSQVIENFNRDIERSRLRSEQSKARIRAARAAQNAPQGSPAPRSVSPATAPQIAPAPLSPITGAIPSPSLSPGSESPARPMVPPVSPLDNSNRLGPTGYVNQPASNEPTIDEQASQINSMYDNESYYATNPVEAKRVEDMRASALDQLYGSRNPNAYKEYTRAKSEGYTGKFEDWKKMARQTLQMSDNTTPYKPSELKSMFDSAGRNPPLGYSPADASKNPGQYKIRTAAGEKEGTQMLASNSILDTMEDMLFGEKGLYVNEKGMPQTKEWYDRFTKAPNDIWNYYSQDDIRIKNYEDFKTGSVTPFVKSLGTAGALSDEDVEKALTLYTSLFPIRDKYDLAKAKFKNLRSLVDRGRTNQIKVANRGLYKGMVDGDYVFAGGDPDSKSSWITKDQWSARQGGE